MKQKPRVDRAPRRRSARSSRPARTRAREPRVPLDEFLAVVSHELRTPLATILGWVHMLRTQDLAADRREHALAVIERNARAQARLIADLIDVSRIASDKLRVRASPVALEPVVRAALDEVRAAAAAKSVALELRATSKVPDVEGDGARLQQVAACLLSNGVKFTPAGGRVTATLRCDGRAAVVLAVEDSGQGIAPEFLPHVFEPFRQAAPTLTRSHGGLGVGLAIARHIVELHGGSITASSAGAGRGATFEVRLPTARAHAPARRRAR